MPMFEVFNKKPLLNIANEFDAIDDVLRKLDF